MSSRMTGDRNTVIITGAGGALGRAIALQVMRNESSYGVFTLRDSSSPTSTSALTAALTTTQRDKSATASVASYELATLDLARLSNVRAFASEINRRVSNMEIPRIRALILNAGYQEHFTLTKTVDGFDTTFQVNYLGHFLLTNLLLPSMDEQCRVLTIGSWMHDPDDPRVAPGILTPDYRPLLNAGIQAVARGEWNTPENDPSAAAGLRRYAAAKLCQVSFMLELQRRFNANALSQKMSSSALDPGGMSSGLMKRGSWLQGYVINQWAGWALAPLMTWWWPNGILRTPQKSAGDAIDIMEGRHGDAKGVYFNGSSVYRPGEEAGDLEVGRKLWEESVRLAGLKSEEVRL